MTAELLDESVDDVETLLIAWLKDLYPPGHVANTRRSGDPLPFILVHHLASEESIEESNAQALVSIHVLTHKAAGEKSSRDETDRMHRRMLLLGRYLEADASIDSVRVAAAPTRQEYGDETILRRVGRYDIGLSYAREEV